MHATRRATGRYVAGMVLGALLLLGFRPAAGSADAPVPPAGRTALMVFLSYDGNQSPPATPTDLRRTAAREIADVLEAGGRAVVTYPELEPVMREGRIRSDRSLDAGTLALLADSTGADKVAVVTLVLYSDRMVALAREIDVASGLLAFVNVAEQPADELWSAADATLETWREAVRAAATRLRFEEVLPAAGGSTLAVLPMEPVGVTPGHADVTLHCLLRSLLETGRCRVPDPSLVRSAVRRGGFSPGMLEPGGRKMLARDFGADALLFPGMVSFGQDSRPTGPVQNDADYDIGDVTLEPEARQPIYLSLLAVDCGTGRVTAARGEYLEAEEPLGLFGIVRDIEVAARLRRGAEHLASILSEIEGDS